MRAIILMVMPADNKDLPRLLRKIRRHEESTDILEHKISEYLAEVVHAQLSSAASKTVLSLMSMINDLERIGDHGEKIALLLERAMSNGAQLPSDAVSQLTDMAKMTDENLRAMRALILHPERNPIPAAIQREDELNIMRDELRVAHLKRMEDRETSAQAGIIFMDLVTSFEKMGDHSFNVVEATAGIK